MASSDGTAPMRRPLRFLFVSNHAYPPEWFGGSETTTHELCLALGRRGIGCAVLAGRSRRKVGPLSALQRRLAGRFAYPVFRAIDPAAALSAVAARVRPSLAVVQAGWPMPLVEACLGLGLPTLLYVHDVEFDRFGGALVPRPGLACIANSHFTAARVKEVLGLELPVVLPLLDPARYAVATRGRAVLFVNPHPLKGAELALALAESLPGVRFEFVESWELGEGLRRRYRARAERAGNVSWRRGARDVRRHYARARLLLVPSRWEESFGRVVSEAQVSGIPALAARRGGLPEAVGAGGLLFDPEAEFGCWRDALARLLEDAHARDALSRAALLHAQRPEIQPDVVVERFLEHAIAHVESAR